MQITDKDFTPLHQLNLFSCKNFLEKSSDWNLVLNIVVVYYLNNFITKSFSSATLAEDMWRFWCLLIKKIVGLRKLARNPTGFIRSFGNIFNLPVLSGNNGLDCKAVLIGLFVQSFLF